MNALAPPKAESRLWRTALRKLELRTAYHIAAFAAKLLEQPYWFWESRRGRLADLIDNERDDEDRDDDGEVSGAR
jgi:hypothetical protein